MAERRPKIANDFWQPLGGLAVSIVRVGLGETKNFAEGYEAIFGKKKEEKKQDEPTPPPTTEQAKMDDKKDEE